MKKIIKGKVYDTETAQELGTITSNVGPNDYGYWEETLYKKRTGEYFLHGSGNAASRYARQVAQNEWTGGETIRPMSFEAARKWAEESMDADDYESIFGKVVEDDYRLNAVLPASLKAAMDERQNQTGESLTDMVRTALEVYLNRPETYEEKPETSASGISYKYFIRNGSGNLVRTAKVSRADRAQFVENLKAQGLTERLSTTSQHFRDLADIGQKQDGLSAGQKAMIDEMYDQR